MVALRRADKRATIVSMCSVGERYTPPATSAHSLCHHVTTSRLAVWGKNDPFFVPAGAEAFRRDIPGAVGRFFDTGHFALETHACEISESIRDFLK